MRQRAAPAMRRRGCPSQSIKSISAMDSIFNDLGQASSQLACRQSGQRVSKSLSCAWAPKRADHVLAQRMVDRRLAPTEGPPVPTAWWAPAQKAPRAYSRLRQGRHVAHHATTQSKQHSLTVTGAGQQCVKIRFSVAQSLCASPSAASLRTAPGAAPMFAPSTGRAAGDSGVGHDHGRRCVRQTRQVAGHPAKPEPITMG